MDFATMQEDRIDVAQRKKLAINTRGILSSS